MLNLRLFASGATQHVFSSVDGDAAWLYKLPAVFDDLLPHLVSWRTLRPTVRWKRAAWSMLTYPPRTIGRLTGPLSLVTRVTAPFAVRINARLSIRARAARVGHFHSTSSILVRLLDTGACDSLLPFHFVDRNCTLHLPDGSFREYRGAVLVQKRADHFFEYFDNFHLFDWPNLVAAQHDLWRHGVAFTDADEILGPRNWALMNGQILLGDTGSLTENADEARKAMSDSNLATRRREIAEWWPHTDLPALDNYLEFVRRHINPETFNRLWRSAGHRQTE